jgi:hypothetical protein
VRTVDELRTEEVSLIVMHPGDQLVSERSLRVSSTAMIKGKQQNLVQIKTFSLKAWARTI